MTTVLEKLEKTTYVVEHSPNCPSPYLVRLVGAMKGTIDKLPPGRTRDACGYGKTLEAAAVAAFAARQQQKENHKRELALVTERM